MHRAQSALYWSIVGCIFVHTQSAQPTAVASTRTAYIQWVLTDAPDAAATKKGEDHEEPIVEIDARGAHVHLVQNPSQLHERCADLPHKESGTCSINAMRFKVLGSTQ